MIEEDVADIDGEGNTEGVQHFGHEELLVVEAEGVPVIEQNEMSAKRYIPELHKAPCNLVHSLFRCVLAPGFITIIIKIIKVIIIKVIL